MLHGLFLLGLIVFGVLLIRATWGDWRSGVVHRGRDAR